jgi:hypothetical protein
VVRVTRRVARKPRTCTGCDDRIPVGDAYLAQVCSPNHDGLGNEKWWQVDECASCANRYGRAHLLIPPRKHIAGRRRGPRRRPVGVVTVHLPAYGGTS